MSILKLQYLYWLTGTKRVGKGSLVCVCVSCVNIFHCLTNCHGLFHVRFLIHEKNRDCATKIVDGLRPLIGDVLEEPEIAGPGFINLKFKTDYLAGAIQRMAADAERLAVPIVT